MLNNHQHVSEEENRSNTSTQNEEEAVMEITSEVEQQIEGKQSDQMRMEDSRDMNTSDESNKDAMVMESTKANLNETINSDSDEESSIALDEQNFNFIPKVISECKLSVVKEEEADTDKLSRDTAENVPALNKEQMKRKKRKAGKRRINQTNATTAKPIRWTEWLKKDDMTTIQSDDSDKDSEPEQSED